MVSVTEGVEGAGGDGGDGDEPPPAGRRRGRPRWRRWLVLGIAALVVLAVITIGLPILRFWLQIRTIDHTVAHGDACLDERQGANLRCWDLHVPPDLDAGSVPLVIDLHGFLNRPSTQRGYSRLDRLADEEGFIVLWPFGIDWSWNGGGDPWPSDRDRPEVAGIGCCGPALNRGLDDVEVVRQIIERVAAEQPIDPDRIFVTGFSNGCTLAQRIAAEASDLIDGVACMAGFLLTDVPPSYRPVPVAVFNGTDDDIAPYEAGFWPGAEANIDTWRVANGCGDASTEVWRDGEDRMVQWSDCDGAPVALVTLDGAGHLIYEGNGGVDVDTTRLAWEFLVANA